MWSNWVTISDVRQVESFSIQLGQVRSSQVNSGNKEIKDPQRMIKPKALGENLKVVMSNKDK